MSDAENDNEITKDTMVGRLLNRLADVDAELAVWRRSSA
jgi:hypothetical protein